MVSLDVIKTHIMNARRTLKNKFIVTGAVILGLYVAMFILGPYISPSKANQQNLRNVLRPPSTAHWFGTDWLGRDVLSRVLIGSRYTLTVVFLSLFLTAVIGVPIGLVSGYSKGMVDNGIMRIVDIFLTFPGMLLAIVVVSVLGMGLQGLVIAVVTSFVPRLIRLTRGVTLSTREREFVTAASAVGAGKARIMFVHILPNSAGSILVELSLMAGQAVLMAAALGFLGLGVKPPAPEWGVMISQGKDYLAVAPYTMFAPGLAICLLVLGFNLLGDGLRDALDPHFRG